MKHIVQLVAEKEGCNEYMVFEAAALALCKVNAKAQAHLWWCRYEVAKRNLKPENALLNVSPEVVNYLLNVMFPPKAATPSATG